MQINLGLGQQPDQQTQDGDQRVRRFSFPQFKTSSQNVNQANSEAMAAPQVTTANDPFSGAKAEMSQLPTSLPASQLETKNSSTPSQSAPLSSPTGEKENTVPNPIDVKTVLPALEAEQRKMDKATDPSVYEQSVTDAKRLAQVAAQKQTDLANFVPEQQPVSTGRKIGAIATGILSGIMTKNPNAAIQQYRSVAYAPAYRQQGLMKQQAGAADVAAKDAGTIAQRDIDSVKTQGDVGKTRADVLGKQEEAQEYAQTGASAAQAKTTADQAAAEKSKADAWQATHPKPEMTPQQPGVPIIQTSVDPDTKQWKTKVIPSLGGINKLSEADQPIVLGAVGKAGKDPQKFLEDYYKGDPETAAFAANALLQYHKSLNPQFSFPAQQLTPVFDNDGGFKGGIIFNQREGTFKAVSPHEMGMDAETDFFKTPPKKLDQRDSDAATGIQGYMDVADDLINKIKKVSKDRPQALAGLGALQGRFGNAELLAGIKDPELREIASKLGSAQAFLTRVHSGRTTQGLLEEFGKSIARINEDPANAIAALEAQKDTTRSVADAIVRLNPKAQGIENLKKFMSGKSGGFNEGDVVVTKQGKVKVTKVHDDGSFDADPVDEKPVQVNQNGSNDDSNNKQTVAQRHNNPLNIKVGAATKKYIDLGYGEEGEKATDGGKFIKFKTPEQGFNAALDLLSTTYKNLSVDEAMKKWSNSGYDSTKVDIPGISKDSKIGDLSLTQKASLVESMAKLEGYDKGN